jgi:hypothetical protein
MFSVKGLLPSNKILVKARAKGVECLWSIPYRVIVGVCGHLRYEILFKIDLGVCRHIHC